jgi:predicted nucleotidyltransferase component of viral defense system
VKSSTQLKALIRNLSQKLNIEAEVLLRNYMFERFLERVSVSSYKHNFILKGGMLIAAMVGVGTRTTMDLDATIKGHTLSKHEIIAIIKDILNNSFDDGVIFSYQNIEEIREGAEYPGYRISVNAFYDKIKQILKIDITTGDVITPREIEYSYKLMFEDRSIHIMAYNLESILAEKFETIITRGIANSRMRDFFDVYILIATQSFNIEIFNMALYKTINRRNTINQMADAKETIQMIETSLIMIDLWQRYQLKYSYAADIAWEMVIKSVKDLNDKSERVLHDYSTPSPPP